MSSERMTVDTELASMEQSVLALSVSLDNIRNDMEKLRKRSDRVADVDHLPDVSGMADVAKSAVEALTRDAYEVKLKLTEKIEDANRRLTDSHVEIEALKRKIDRMQYDLGPLDGWRTLATAAIFAESQKRVAVIGSMREAAWGSVAASLRCVLRFETKRHVKAYDLKD